MPAESPTPSPANYAARHKAHFDRLCESDSVIRGYRGRIVTLDGKIEGLRNVQASLRVAIRARERGLASQATRLLRKETGIHAFPGQLRESPQETVDRYRREARDVLEREKAARAAARKVLSNP